MSVVERGPTFVTRAESGAISSDRIFRPFGQRKTNAIATTTPDAIKSFFILEQSLTVLSPS